MRRFFNWCATKTSAGAGHPITFGTAVAVIIVWLATGPLFHFSDTWQLVINTGTTVVTFLMVFLIQHAQNKDTRAIELKLNEIVAAMPGASNRMIDVEALSEEELEMLHRYYRKLVSLSKKDAELTASHSVEEATVRHARKKKRELAIASGSDQPPAS